MRKLILPIMAIFTLSCSTDSEIFSDEIIEEASNKQPTINAQSLSVDEHSLSGTSIGTIIATDTDNDELTFSIDNESGLDINENTGEIKLGADLVLDFENKTSVPFTVSVFDGTTIIDQDFDLLINDINEYDLLSVSQKETITYFNYLTLWQSPTHNPLEKNSRWQAPMTIFLDGELSEDFRTNIESVIEEYNILFEDSDFNITIVDTKGESNAHLFIGETASVEELWADMFEIINGKTYSGYAMTANNSSILSDSRIWVSSSSSILFKHELGHALGFGHSDKCDTENSFMCSNISPEHDFLEIEKDVIRYAYNNEMAANLTEEEIQAYLANKMLLER